MAGEDCTCADRCPGSDVCACLFNHESGHCHCECDDKIVIHGPKMLLEARVNLTACDIDLARLGEFLGRQTGAELLIPASRVREKVTMDVKDATLAEVLERAGLVVGDPGPEAGDGEY